MATPPETPKKPRSKAAKTTVEAQTPQAGRAVAAKAAELPKAPKKPTGRPSTYNQATALRIGELLADGIPLREICRMEGMPPWRTVYNWMAADADLAARIAHARDLGYEAIAEECLLIADNPQYGEKQVMGDQGATTTVEDMLGHRKLRIETRLKLLAKWRPDKYGDKVQLAGDAANPIKVETESQADKLMSALLTNLELRRQE